MLAHLKQFGRRFLTMLGGEALQSAFHFAFNIVLMRLLPARDYGLFAMVMLIGGVALTYIRPLAGMPANLFIPAYRGRRRAGAFACTFGSGALVLSVLFGALVAAGLTPWLGVEAGLAGLFVGLWSMRSYLRMALFAVERQVQSTICDAVYMATGLVFALVFIHGSAAGLLTRVFAILGAANLCAIASALMLSGLPVRISFGPAMRRRYAGMAGQLGWAMVGVTTANLQGQGQVAMIAALAGPAAYAPVAAMVVFFAPMRLIASALANLMQPELARQAAFGNDGRIRHLLLVWTAAMLGVGLVYGGAMLVALPWLSAPIFAGQPKLLLAVLAWAANMAMLLSVMPRILLEVLRRFRAIAVMTAASAVAGSGLVALLLLQVGTAWSLAGSVVSEAMVLLWCWSTIHGPQTSKIAARASRSGSLLPLVETT